MGHYEDIKIDRSEGWKYSNTHGTSGDDYHARVYVDDKGEISKDSYSQEYNDKNGNNDKPDKKGNDKKGNDKSGNSGEKKEGCLTKIIKAPFRFLWWLIKFILKNALVILTFGIANGWFDKKDD